MPQRRLRCTQNQRCVDPIFTGVLLNLAVVNELKRETERRNLKPSKQSRKFQTIQSCFKFEWKTVIKFGYLLNLFMSKYGYDHKFRQTLYELNRPGAMRILMKVHRYDICVGLKAQLLPLRMSISCLVLKPGNCQNRTALDKSVLCRFGDFGFDVSLLTVTSAS